MHHKGRFDQIITLNQITPVPLLINHTKSEVENEKLTKISRWRIVGRFQQLRL